MNNNLFKPGALVFDIGASYGESVDRLVAGGAGKVISVEPSVWNYIQLLKARERHPGKCVPIPAACGRQFGMLNVTLATDRPGLTSVEPDHWSQAYPDAKWGDPQPVVCVPVWSLMEIYGTPEYLKVDVEGYESSVLSGMGSYHPPVVSFEFHRQFPRSVDACLTILRGNGYTKACYTESDIDLETVPTMNFKEFGEKFHAANPNWGNITVI